MKFIFGMLFKLLIGIFFAAQLCATSLADLTLILGASPNEESVLARTGLADDPSVYFISSNPQIMDDSHSRYFNINFNDPVQFEAFATSFAGQFNEIYFDWSVLKFFEYAGFSTIHKLLKTGGSLIIPQPSVGAYFGTTVGYLNYTKDSYEEDIRSYFKTQATAMAGPLCRIDGLAPGASSSNIVRELFIEELTKRIDSYGFTCTLLSNNDVDTSRFDLITMHHPEFIGKNFNVLRAFARA